MGWHPRTSPHRYPTPYTPATLEFCCVTAQPEVINLRRRPPLRFPRFNIVDQWREKTPNIICCSPHNRICFCSPKWSFVGVEERKIPYIKRWLHLAHQQTTHGLVLAISREKHVLLCHSCTRGCVKSLRHSFILQLNLFERPPVYKDHMLIKTTFHAIKPTYKDHLCIRTTFYWSLGWSLYTSFTVYALWIQSRRNFS